MSILTPNIREIETPYEHSTNLDEVFESTTNLKATDLEGLTLQHKDLCRNAWLAYQRYMNKPLARRYGESLQLFRSQSKFQHDIDVVQLGITYDDRPGYRITEMLYTFGSLIELSTDLATKGRATRWDHDPDRQFLGVTQPLYSAGKVRDIPVINFDELAKLDQLLRSLPSTN